MQVSPIISSVSPTFINSHYSSMCSSSSTDFAEISVKLPQDFTGKLKLDVSDTETTEKSVAEESFYDCNNHHDEKQQQQQHHHHHHHHHHQEEQEESEESEEDDDDDDEDEEEFEFSFVSTDHDGSPVSAEDIFSNGEIRPMFPLFNRDLLFAGGYDGDSKGSSHESTLRPPLRKVFVEKRDLPSTSSGMNDSEERPVGEFCVWRGKAVEASPEVCKKSNSTGFSRLWRFRDLLHRSSSDGKDAFVFFQESTKPNQRNEKVVKIVKVEKREVSTEKRNAGEVKTKTERRIAGAGEKVQARGGKGKTASLSPHEKHYARNRAMKEENRRRSYLPYRQDLVGFFTNVNGLSRNVHPF